MVMTVLNSVPGVLVVDPDLAPAVEDDPGLGQRAPREVRHPPVHSHGGRPQERHQGRQVLGGYSVVL